MIQSQKAAIAVDLIPFYAIEAGKRMKAGVNLRLQKGEGYSSDQAGNNVGVSGSYVEKAIIHAHKCLCDDTIPKAGPECDYCDYVKAVGSYN